LLEQQLAQQRLAAQQQQQQKQRQQQTLIQQQQVAQQRAGGRVSPATGMTSQQVQKEEDEYWKFHKQLYDFCYNALKSTAPRVVPPNAPAETKQRMASQQTQMAKMVMQLEETRQTHGGPNNHGTLTDLKRIETTINKLRQKKIESRGGAPDSPGSSQKVGGGPHTPTEKINLNVKDPYKTLVQSLEKLEAKETDGSLRILGQHVRGVLDSTRQAASAREVG